MAKQKTTKKTNVEKVIKKSNISTKLESHINRSGAENTKGTGTTTRPKKGNS